MSAPFSDDPVDHDVKADSMGDMAGVKRALFGDAKALTDLSQIRVLDFRGHAKKARPSRCLAVF